MYSDCSFPCVLPSAQHLRQANIAGRFVEFFGPGVSQLSVPDRTTIANMCPEYNATVSFFPIDQVTLKHFNKTSESQRETFTIIGETLVWDFSMWVTK
jgi:aconitase A